MILANKISKYYTIQNQRKCVFKDLSFQIKRGEKVALMGRNGAGKSTLLRIICGIENPSLGEIKISGKLSWPVGVGGGFLPTLSGRENIRFVCRLYRIGREETQEKLAFVKEFSELEDYFDMPLKSYSSGMRSRLAFGMSMAFDFDFYIVDEAMAVGDPIFKKKSIELFRKKARNCGIIMVSHSINTVKLYCDRGMYLNDGQVYKSNDLNEIIKRYQTQKIVKK